MLLLVSCGFQTQSLPGAQQPKESPASEFRAQISVTWPGASPSEIEEFMAYPIENAMNSLPELESIRTSIHNSQCQITLKFTEGADANECKKALETRLQGMSELLEVAGKIELQILPPPEIPPLWVCWKPAEQGQSLSATNMRKLQGRIQRLPHVDEVQTFGTRITFLNVVVDQAALRRSDLSFKAIQDAIAEWKVQQQTRTDRELPDVSELEELVLKSSADRQFLLRDVAQVQKATQESSPVKFNGRPSIALAIRLTASARNTERLELETSLQEQFLEMQQDLEVKGELSLAFPTQGADVRVDLKLPAGTSADMQERIVHQVVQELSPLLMDSSWLLIESEEAIAIQVGQTTEPKILIQEMSEKLSTIPGVKINISNLREVPLPIVVQISGPDLDLLSHWAHSISNELRSLRGVRGISLIGAEMMPELEIVVDREKAERLGLDEAMIANSISQKLNKNSSPSDVELPIVVSLGPSDEAVDVSSMTIPLPDGGQIHVSEVARIQLKSAPESLIRVDYQRTIEIHIQADSQAGNQSIRRDLKSILDNTRPARLSDEFRVRVE
jgi:multidrug efflux pump subunit AcrB